MTLRYYYLDRTYIYHRDKRWWGVASRDSLETCLKRIVHSTIDDHEEVYKQVDQLPEDERISFLLNFLETDRGRGVRILYLENETTGEVYFDHRDTDVIIPF